MQNELIARGYITSLIDVPSQSLNDGILSITLSYGYIGNISWASGNSATTSLWNAIPAKTGDILKLTELEQGMANLQRLPGSSAQMKIMPGKNHAESDIQISRHLARNWQVGAWLDDAGSRSSGRYQAGGALYLYDLTTLNDIFYLSMGAMSSLINITMATRIKASIILFPLDFGHSIFTVHKVNIVSSSMVDTPPLNIKAKMIMPAQP